MTHKRINWCTIIPLANEEKDFAPFVDSLADIMDTMNGGHAYLVVDDASQDRTRELCEKLQTKDRRFTMIWAPNNKNVVDAYLTGLRAALDGGYDLVIEMDGGLSHDPRAIPMFIRVLNEGNECAFGSRFINGGSMVDSSRKRWFLSKAGTLLTNILLGTKMRDMTSGYQGFHREVLISLLNYPLLSKAHFYQTEVRYLLREKRMMEVPIHYRAASPRVSNTAILSSFRVLFHYFCQRILCRARRI